MEPVPKRPRVEKGTYHGLTPRQCQGVLKSLQKMQEAVYFLKPVDYVLLGIPDYPVIVKEPMDMGTIERNLDGLSGAYGADDFVEHMRLVFFNAALYNPRGTPVAVSADRLANAFEQKLASLVSSDRIAGPATGGAEGAGGLPLKTAKAIVRSLTQHGHSAAFRVPVDPVRLGIPTYFEVITRPMDLSTVAQKLSSNQYATVGTLKADLELIWDNAVTFNGATSAVGAHAQALRDFAAKKFEQEPYSDEAAIVNVATAVPRLPSAPPKPKSFATGTSGTVGVSGSARKRSAPGAGAGSIPATSTPLSEAEMAAVETAQAVMDNLVPAGDVMLTMRMCKQLLLPLKAEPNADYFLSPVDDVALNLPDYKAIVKKPMDLGTIQRKLELSSYSSAGEFVEDTRLVWSNARLYNPVATLVHQAAIYFLVAFERALHQAVNPGEPLPPCLQASIGPTPSAPPPVLPKPEKPLAPAPMRELLRPVPVSDKLLVDPPPPRPPAAPPAPVLVAGTCGNGMSASAAAVAADSEPPGLPLLEGAELVTSKYHKVVRILRQQPAAKYFRDPVNWQKLGLTNYPDLVPNPMDLGTVLRKVERLEYETVDALRADVDLIWDNAIAFNGEGSWIKKYVDEMRTISARKFNEADARPLGVSRKPSVSRPSLPAGTIRGVGNLPFDAGRTSRFITPQMRLHLLDSAVKLRDVERVQLGELAQQVCPRAVERCGSEGRETKIDVDLLDPLSFVKLDVYVRAMLATPAAQTA